MVLAKTKTKTTILLKTKTKGLMLARSMWTAGELITGASYSVINKRHHPLVDSGSDEQHSKGQRQPTTHTFTTPCAIINTVNVITGSGGGQRCSCKMGKGHVHRVCTFLPSIPDFQLCHGLPAQHIPSQVQNLNQIGTAL